MALTNPGIAYETIMTAIRTLLRDNMATLNTGLDVRFTFTKNAQIDFGDVNTPVPFSNLPSILIDWTDKDETFSSIGAAGSKHPIIKFSLIIIGRNTSGRDDAIIEKVRLLKNTEAIFRDNIDISGSVLISNPSFAGAGLYKAGESIYVTATMLTLECTVEVA